MSEKIQFAESKVSELTMDGQQAISSVEQSVNLPAEDVVAVREEIGLSVHLEKIRDKGCHLFDRLKEKVLGLFAKEKGIDTTTTKKPEDTKGSVLDIDDEKARDDENVRRRARALIERKHERDLPKGIIEEARKRRDKLLDARNLFSISEEDFNTYFLSRDSEVHANLKQKNVGDCYLLAAIHAMSCSPNFEMFCRSSMKRLPDGSWQVRFPLMSKDGQVITITPEELLPQSNRQFLGQGKDGKLDSREQLIPVEGKEGLQVLEAAFIKQKFGSVDRLAAEGGFGVDVLMSFGGDNFINYQIDSKSTYSWEKEEWDFLPLNSAGPRSSIYLDFFLENFNSEIYMATADTPSQSKAARMAANDSPFFKVDGTTNTFLVYSHAYSISSVDTEKKMIILVNPWDTSKPLELTFDQFKDNFHSLGAVRINMHKFLNSMGHLEEKKAT